MNIEKGLLLAGIAFMVIMTAVFALHSTMSRPEYAINKMIVKAHTTVDRHVSSEFYRLTSLGNPFLPKEESKTITVEFDLPPLPEVNMVRPPVFWNREDN